MTEREPPSRIRTSLRRLAHLLGVVVGWVGFVWLWMLVATRPWESQRLMWLMLGSLLVAPLLTGAWVLHNRSLYRRKGERQAVSVVDMGYAHDWHGRQVQADWATLCRSRMVLVSIDGERKLYHGSLVDNPSAAPQALPAAVAAARPLATAPRAPLR
jgi:hypothetical protein